MSNSEHWLREHFSDHYVKQACKQGYPSRSAYKLLELQEKDRIFSSGMSVVDLGAAPGGWSMVASQLVGIKGSVIALDKLKMNELTGVHFIQGDFTTPEIHEQLMQHLGNKLIDIVISDMAPNITGCKSSDQPRAMYLAELAWHCAQQVLTLQGQFLVKVFQGTGVTEFIKELRDHFRQVLVRKPKASRARSSEIYILARGYISQSRGC